LTVFKDFVYYINGISDSEDKDSKQATAGSRFCKALITSFDQFILRKTESTQSRERIHVVTALKSLLAVSQTAKATALECKHENNKLIQSSTK